MAPPPPGLLYHGVYPGGRTGHEDDLTPADVDAYEAASGARVAWIYFSNNWYRERTFPAATATWIRERGAVPWIRLMLRSSTDPHEARRERTFRPERIADGDLDDDLRRWARGARDFGTPVVVELGTECNGKWFPWNARWNGAWHTGWGDAARPDGAEVFAAAYRHVVEVMRAEGATNLTWVFHVNWEDQPARDWNRLEAYYPGDDVVDWLAVSAYGPQSAADDVVAFRAQMDAVVPRLVALAPGKPIVVAEFGCTALHPDVAPDAWAAAAFADLLQGRWPAVIGFSWWNERWPNDDDPAHDTTMRLQDLPALAGAVRGALLHGVARLQLSPVLVAAPTPPPGSPPSSR